MNILLINHYAGSVDHGMEYRPFYLARKWIELGHQVTIVAASFSHVRMKNPEVRGMGTEQDVQGIRYLWLKTPRYSGNGLGRIINMLTFLAGVFRVSGKLARWKPDVVIASSTYPLDIYPANWIAKKAKAKLVFEVHDLWPLSPIELGGMSPKHPFIRAIQKAEDDAYRLCDQTVSLLPKADSHMMSHGLKREKFLYLPNGIDIQEWESMRKPLPPEHAKLLADLRAQGRFIVGYVGSHGLANALESLVRSAGRLKDQPVSLVFVGHGPQKAALSKLAGSLGHAHVHFLESVSKTQVPALLDEMDALFISAQRSTLYRFGVSPNKLIDYMAASKPVIHAIEAGNDLVSESGAGISIPPEDPEAIATAILRLKNCSAEERKDMGARGREYVLANHDYRVLAQRFLAHLG